MSRAETLQRTARIWARRALDAEAKLAAASRELVGLDATRAALVRALRRCEACSTCGPALCDACRADAEAGGVMPARKSPAPE